jgi:hypothetical protein
MHYHSSGSVGSSFGSSVSFRLRQVEVWIYFCTHRLNLHLTQSGSIVVFFHLWVYLKFENQKNFKRNLKIKPARNPKKLIYKIRRAPKTDGFGFECQILPVSAGSSVKFNPTIFFRGSDYRLT